MHLNRYCFQTFLAFMNKSHRWVFYESSKIFMQDVIDIIDEVQGWNEAC